MTDAACAVHDDDRAAIAKGRGNVYHLLSLLYLTEVTSEFLDTLRSDSVAPVLKDLGFDIEKIVSNHTQDEDKDKDIIEALAEEYCALFVLPRGLSPYESVRLKGLLCQEPEDEVIEFYNKCGLKKSDNNKVIADHLGMELEFMGFLADKEATAWEKVDEQEATRWSSLQKEFFSDHPNKWVFDMLNDMDHFALHPFYKELCTLSRGFLEIERDDLEVEKLPARV